jgi:phosphoribosylaminoimidazolecarboxamide formyltransferase/IMP cyclohydrolase
VQSTDNEDDIIEKIDIGGISLIRAGAKNYKDVLIVSSVKQYPGLLKLLSEKKGVTSIEDRRHYAAEAFMISSHYDTAIFKYFNRKEGIDVFRESINEAYSLRYGENPHQKGIYFGDPGRFFDKLHGKEISYNNLLDIDAAVNLIDEFDETTFVIIKHNNACGAASRSNPLDAWKDALACDPVSAFGGVIVTNTEVDEITASEIDKLFFEIIIAPGYSQEALEILTRKKNRIILKLKEAQKSRSVFRSLLDGVLWQEKDLASEQADDMKPVTDTIPDPEQTRDFDICQ